MLLLTVPYRWTDKVDRIATSNSEVTAWLQFNQAAK